MNYQASFLLFYSILHILIVVLFSLLISFPLPLFSAITLTLSVLSLMFLS